MHERPGFSTFSLTELLAEEGISCSCGKHHASTVRKVLIEAGAIGRLPGIVRELGSSCPFLLEDAQTREAAGNRVSALLRREKIDHRRFVFPQEKVEPDETAVGQAVLALDGKCDLVIGIGAGTINDIGKVLARSAGLKYVIVATAPSMDGFAASTSSMISDGFKASVDSLSPTAIIADLDILREAPARMLRAGLGDMLAKYISICEWRISGLVNGEYYCGEIAALMRRSLGKCVASAGGYFRREPEAVADIMEGLVLSGLAASFAEVSRPASGMEHYFSHIWDMRDLRFHAGRELHGIQVGVGALYALRVYDKLRGLVPDRTAALASVEAFDYRKWRETLREFLGPSAEALIGNESKEGKYDKASHRARLEKIISLWPAILDIIEEELPHSATLEKLMRSCAMPCRACEIGIDDRTLKLTFLATKDVRGKYIASRLLWDLGLLESFAEDLGREDLEDSGLSSSKPLALGL